MFGWAKAWGESLKFISAAARGSWKTLGAGTQTTCLKRFCRGRERVSRANIVCNSKVRKRKKDGRTTGNYAARLCVWCYYNGMARTWTAKVSHSSTSYFARKWKAELVGWRLWNFEKKIYCLVVIYTQTFSKGNVLFYFIFREGETFSSRPQLREICVRLWEHWNSRNRHGDLYSAEDDDI